MPRSKIVASVAFPLFLAVAVSAAVVWGPQVQDWITVLESLDVATRHSPAVAAAVVGLQVLQVVVFLIPGEVVQIAAGFLFGVLGGAGLSVLGILVGSTVNYWVGRALGTPFVEAVIRRETRRRIDAVLDRRGARVGFFLLFVIPGIPKDILGYVAGSRPLQFSFGPFVLFSMLGRLPGIVGSAMIGASAAAGRMGISVALLGTAVLLLILGITNQRRVEAWIGRLLSRHQGR